MMTKPMDLSGNHEHTGRADTPEARSDAAVSVPPPHRKTILVVSDKYPPHAVGGAEISLHLQLKRIDPATFDIRVAVLDKQRPEPGATEDDYSHDNVRVRRIGALPEWPPTLPAQNGLLPERLRWPVGAGRYLAKATNRTLRDRAAMLSLHRDLSKAKAYGWMPVPDEDLLHFSETVERLSAMIRDIRPDIIHADNYRSILVAASADRGTARLVALVRDNRFFCSRREQNANIDGRACPSCDFQCVPKQSGVDPDRIVNAMKRVHDFRVDRLSQADEVITTSGYLKRQIESVLPGKSAHVVPNPSGGTHFIDAYQAGIERSTPPLILVVGMLNENKGAHRAIDWIAKLKTQLPDFRLVMAGAGRMAADLRARAHTAGVSDYLHLAGYLTRPELFRMYARSTVVIAPNFWPEPFGRVPLEAGLSSRPVVAYDVGGIGESIVDGETGFLLPPQDEDALIERVVECIKNPQRAMQMGAAARAHILSAFNADTSAGKLTSMWSRLLGGPD